MEILLTGRIFSGRQAFELGLASQVLPATEVLPAAQAMAHDIADNVAPVSAAITKQLGKQFLEETDRAVALERERVLFRWVGQQADAREGVEAFLEKRPPNWVLSKNGDLPEALGLLR
jgi:enoyl-CoA hydratase/carnithine racemase